MPHEEIIANHKRELEARIPIYEEAIEDLYRRHDETNDEVRKKDLAESIVRMKRQLELVQLKLSSFDGFLHLAADNTELDRRFDQNIEELRRVRETITDTRANLTTLHSDSAGVMTSYLIQNEAKLDKIERILGEYISTYKQDRGINSALGLTNLMVGFGGFVAGVAALGVGIKALLNAPPPTPPVTPGPLRVDRSDHALNSLAAALPDGPSGPDSSDELEAMMLELVTDKELIASGKVTQAAFWKSMADLADKTALESQEFVLTFVQQGLSGLPESQDFLWLDPSEMEQRYTQLYAACKRTNLLSDLYNEAPKLEYGGKPIPFFHVALLLQMCLGLRKHDLLFADNTVAR